MKSRSFLAFPISLALIWSAAAPFSCAAPAPLSVDVEVEDILVSSRSVIAAPSPLEEANGTTTGHHLVRRGCFQSKPDPSNVGPITCSGDVPPHDELVAQIQRHGNVGKKVSAFYTRLQGASAIKTCKCWINTYPAEIPNPPGAVFFDEIIDNDYDLAVSTAMQNAGGVGRLVSYQKFLSQIFAEQSSGTAWIFAPADLDFSTLDDLNTWKNWEFPALTQNKNIDFVKRTDPNDGSDPPSITTIWRQGDPTQVPRGLVSNL